MRILTILCLAFVALAADAQTITDALRRDQKGQGKVVVNQSADIERLVNNRQPQTTTTQQATKPVEKTTNNQQSVKTTSAQQQPKTTPAQQQQSVKVTPAQQQQSVKTTQTQVKPQENIQDRTAEKPQEMQTTQPERTQQPPAARTQTEQRVTERPVTSYTHDTDATAVNTNKKIMRHSYKTTGYRIQVFTGGNTRADRTKCEQIGARLKATFPDQPIYVHFYSPSWKCRVGNFTSMSDAKALLKQIRKMGYNQACLVKGTINVQY